MLELKSPDFKDLEAKPKSSFLEVLLKTENLDNNLLILLYQFLLTYDFESTAKCLLEEANKLGYDALQENFSPKDTISEDVCSRILAEFKSGDWKKFFKLWNHSLPETIKSTMDYKALTMKLRVHFAILPIRSVELSKGFSLKGMSNGINETDDDSDSDPDVETAYDTLKAASMNQLKIYLKTDGMDLVDCNTCIPFFALPYVENPMNDSTISHIFTTSWVDELTMNLKIFLVKHREITSTKESRSPSLKPSMKSIIVTNKERMGQIEKNLQILDSLDLVDNETKNMTSHTKNERLDILKTTLEDLKDDCQQIIPNDRNIPIFFEGEELEEESYYHRKTKVKIRSTQTRIQGIKNITTLLATDELSHPVRVFDPQILLRSPKKSTRKYEEELSWTMTRFQNVYSNYQRLKLRFYQLHSDNQKLNEVAGELTKALEDSVRGNSVSLQRVLESCMIIFPDLFNKNLKFDSKDELKLKSENEIQQNQIKITHCFDLTPLSPKSIDFKKVKFHLICGNLRTKLLLLQALRWKITSSQQGERDEVLHEYIINDLLGLHVNITCNGGKKILPFILYPAEGTISVLQQTAARFLNTVASLRCGRDYLSIGTTILNAVVESLNGSNDSGPDAFTYDMLLAMLQKLSVRKLQRINMIKAGLVEWLIHHLNVDGCKMSPYRLKYVSALLMNLSLHNEARTKASSEARLIISLLTDLLLTENQAALPFISGALSNFLLNRNINEEGKKLGLESVLKYYRKRSSVEKREYLDHIIKLHNREDEVEQEEVSDNDNDEYDLIEDELDEDDPVQNEAGDLTGEILLASYYSISENEILSGVEKSDSQPGELQKIIQNREMIPRLSKEKNLIRLRPIYTTSYVEENPDSSKLLGIVSQIEGEQSSEYSLAQGNSSMMNLIDYTSTEDSKLQKTSFDFYSSPHHGVTTIFQQQTPSNNSEWSQFLITDTEKNFKNCSIKSKNNPIIDKHLEISQSTYKTSDEEVKLPKKSSEATTTSIPSGIDSLPEAQDILSSIASLESSNIEDKNLQKEEEAFLAKPKLQRTPPHSAILKKLNRKK